jgi:hypothetical protein
MDCFILCHSNRIQLIEGALPGRYGRECGLIFFEPGQRLDRDAEEGIS